MSKPSITAFLGAQTYPGTPVETAFIAEFAYDRAFKQHMWQFSQHVDVDFNLVQVPGFFATLQNSPRSTKESLLTVKVPGDASTSGGGSTITNQLGLLGIEELEKTDDFADVIRLSTLVNSDFTAPPPTYSYRAAAYTLSDYTIEPEDEVNRKLVAVYHKTERTENDRKWFSEFGGTLANVVKAGSLLTPISATLNYLTIDYSVKENVDGTFSSTLVSNPDGSWPVVSGGQIGRLDSFEPFTQQIVEADTVIGGATTGTDTVVKTEIEPVDKFKDKVRIITESTRGPELISWQVGPVEKMDYVTKRIVPVGETTKSISVSSTHVTFTTVRGVDRWREEKTVEAQNLIGDVRTEKAIGKLDSLETTTRQVRKIGGSVAEPSVAGDVLTVQETKAVDTWREEIKKTGESLRGPELTERAIGELDAQVNTVRQIVPLDESFVEGVTEDAELTFKETKQVDRWRKETSARYEPYDGPAMVQRVYGKLDAIDTTTKTVQKISADAIPAPVEDKITNKTVTLEERVMVDRWREQKIVKVEKTEGPVLEESKYNSELKNHTLVSKQVVPIGTVTDDVDTSTAGKIIITEHQDIDRWRTWKIVSTLDMTGLAGTAPFYYKTWSGVDQYQFPPCVTSLEIMKSESTSGVASDFSAAFAYKYEEFDGLLDTKFVRAYTTDTTQASLNSFITSLAANGKFPYNVKQFDITIGQAYWAGNTGASVRPSPRAYWASAMFPISRNVSASGGHAIAVRPGSGSTLTITSSGVTLKPVGTYCMSCKVSEWVNGIYVVDLKICTFTA